ncbi:MAG: hypothetical protein QOG64_2364, partial [Acidimicrobiaceae bacterium]|nr:hypothetical protein [Acidimicrobiaceae bacterium]
LFMLNDLEVRSAVLASGGSVAAATTPTSDALPAGESGATGNASVGRPADPAAAAGPDDAVIQAVVAAVQAARSGSPIPTDLNPAPAKVRDSVFDLPNGCEAVDNQDRNNVCPLGDVHASRTMAVIGDSHAGMWLPVLDKLAATAHYRLIPYIKFGCASAEVNRSPGTLHDGGSTERCNSWRAWVVGEVAKSHWDVVVLAYSHHNPIIHADGSKMSLPERIAAFGDGMGKTIQKVRAATKRVVVLGDIPVLGVDPVECVTKRNATLKSCLNGLDEVRAVNASVASAAQVGGAEFIDVLPWFCADACPMVIGNTIVYRDVNHATTVYLEQLTDNMSRHLSL